MFLSRWMDKLLFTYNMEYYPAMKKGQAIYACNNLNDSSMYYAEWKKPVSKGYMLYVSFISHSGKGKLQWWGTKQWSLGVKRRRMVWLQRETLRASGGCWSCPLSCKCWRLRTSMHVLKLIELYTQKKKKKKDFIVLKFFKFWPESEQRLGKWPQALALCGWCWITFQSRGVWSWFGRVLEPLKFQLF